MVGTTGRNWPVNRCRVTWNVFRKFKQVSYILDQRVFFMAHLIAYSPHDESIWRQTTSAFHRPRHQAHRPDRAGCSGYSKVDRWSVHRHRDGGCCCYYRHRTAQHCRRHHRRRRHRFGCVATRSSCSPFWVGGERWRTMWKPVFWGTFIFLDFCKLW